VSKECYLIKEQSLAIELASLTFNGFNLFSPFRFSFISLQAKNCKGGNVQLIETSSRKISIFLNLLSRKYYLKLNYNIKKNYEKKVIYILNLLKNTYLIKDHMHFKFIIM
jgi:hypothetical protein